MNIYLVDTVDFFSVQRSYNLVRTGISSVDNIHEEDDLQAIFIEECDEDDGTF